MQGGREEAQNTAAADVKHGDLKHPDLKHPHADLKHADLMRGPSAQTARAAATNQRNGEARDGREMPASASPAAAQAPQGGNRHGGSAGTHASALAHEQQHASRRDEGMAPAVANLFAMFGQSHMSQSSKPGHQPQTALQTALPPQPVLSAHAPAAAGAGRKGSGGSRTGATGAGGAASAGVVPCCAAVCLWGGGMSVSLSDCVSVCVYVCRILWCKRRRLIE